MRKYFLSAVFCAAAASGCGGTDTTPPPAQQTGTKRVDAATAGSLSGRVSFSGQAPAPAVLRTAADAACSEGGNTVIDESLMVDGTGGLKHAFVYVKDGLADYAFDMPGAPVMLDQKGCKYEPHVFGVRVGQPVEILNSDATLHNVHAIPQRNEEFNQGMPLKGMKLKETFTAPEIGIPFKCDVHGWMTSYGHVVAHPYFAVTDATGAFALPNLPPGTYTIEVWHEKLGTRTQQITIAPSQAASASFTFGQG
ncbi:MAG: carboxypeptidase regulatory-like domain-containing protein [Acidobacteriota bacterium]|nr:carboxypeptidase regulatory-like domain-containing protein [Acidobacteriota bacterium]